MSILGLLVKFRSSTDREALMSAEKNNFASCSSIREVSLRIYSGLGTGKTLVEEHCRRNLRLQIHVHVGTRVAKLVAKMTLGSSGRLDTMTRGCY